MTPERRSYGSQRERASCKELELPLADPHRKRLRAGGDCFWVVGRSWKGNACACDRGDGAYGFMRQRDAGAEGDAAERSSRGAARCKAYLLDDGQHPRLCVLVSVSADTLRKKMLAKVNDNKRDKIRTRSNLQDRPCWCSHRPCKPWRDRREHLRGPEGQCRQGSW